MAKIMRKKILIIDDERDLVAMVKLRLEANNFATLEAFDGKEGIRKAEKEDCDLILLDIILPDIDGYEACKRLRHNPKTKDIPIIIFTASNLKSLAEKAIDAGAVDYIIKPFEPEELVGKISEALKGT